MPRPGSPPTRSSTLITSAPRSPSITDANGPCCQIVQSTTRMPSSGMVMVACLAQRALGVQGCAGPSVAGVRMAAEERQAGGGVDQAMGQQDGRRQQDGLD